MATVVTPIILNQVYNLSNQNNQITVKFPNPLELKNKAIALGYFGLYYSWFNVSSALNNNAFSYIWTDGMTYPVNSGGTYTTTLQDGNYSYSDINNVLIQTMNANNHYVLDANGNPVYFLNLSADTTYYRILFTSTKVEVPSGGTNPYSVTTGYFPQFVIPNTNIQSLFGQTYGTFPPTQSPGGTIYNFLGNEIPQITTITTVNINISLQINSPFNQNVNTIYQFSPNVPYPQFISPQINYPFFYRLADTMAQQITLSLTDQNGLPLQIVDTSSMSFTLLIADAK